MLLSLGGDRGSKIWESSALFGSQRRAFHSRLSTGVKRMLGLNPYKPMILCRIRVLPPISIPNPKREPCNVNRTASPPVEPPGVNLGLRGLTVRP
jgi:hypothetical protein